MVARQNVQLLRKISARTVYGSKADIQALVLADRNNPTPPAHLLFQVFGICNGIRQGQSRDIEEEQAGPNNTTILPPKKDGDGKSKEWTALLGQFQATNQSNGRVYRSGVCFLPNYVTDTVTGQLGGDVESVKFAFNISAKFDADSATSYIFEAENLMPPAPDDPLNAMAMAITDQSGAPKPAPEQPPAAEPGSEPAAEPKAKVEQPKKGR